MNNKQEALEIIYERTYAKAYVIAKQFVKNEEDALDILQEAYISVFNHMESLQDESKLDKWVNMIVANRCKDWLRKKQVVLFSDMGEEAEDDYEATIEEDKLEFLPEASVDYAETKRLMAEILDALPEDQKMCILMYYYDELSVNEIAEGLGCSTGTVKSRLNYARKKIKEEVELLEKKGTKLYGIAPLPFIVWMLKGTETNAAASLNSAGILYKVVEAGASNIGKAEVIKQAANAGGKVLAHSLRNKILIGILAVSVASGGTYAYLQKQNAIPKNNSDEVIVIKDDEEEKTETDSDDVSNKQEYTEENLLEMYRDVIQSGEYQYYAFVDLDGIGIPELLLGKEEDAHVADDETVQMQKATLYKHTESGNKELETIGKISFVLMYHAEERKIEYTWMRMNQGLGVDYVMNTYYSLNSAGQLESTILGVDYMTMTYYYGQEMNNPNFEITEKEYDKYSKKFEGAEEIAFKKIAGLDVKEEQKNEIVSTHQDKIEYIRNIYYSVQENINNYSKEGIEGLYWRYLDGNRRIHKITLYPNQSEFPDGENVEDYVVEYYYDVSGEYGAKLVFAFVVNKRTGEEHRFYQYDNQLIRYIDSEKKTYDNESDIDISSTEYMLYVNGTLEILRAYGH